MATRWSWLTVLTVLVLVIQLSTMFVSAHKSKCRYDDCDYCDRIRICDGRDSCDWDCEDECISGGCKDHGGVKRFIKVNGCLDEVCVTDCKDHKKHDKKGDKFWKKMFKGNKHGKKKCKKDCCDDCCQKIIVQNGPAIIQTVVVDKDLYTRYGCDVCNLPLQKVVVQDEDCVQYPPNECDLQNVRVVTNPCYRSNHHSGYYY